MLCKASSTQRAEGQTLCSGHTRRAESAHGPGGTDGNPYLPPAPLSCEAARIVNLEGSYQLLRLFSPRLLSALNSLVYVCFSAEMWELWWSFWKMAVSAIDGMFPCCNLHQNKNEKTHLSLTCKGYYHQGCDNLHFRWGSILIAKCIQEMLSYSILKKKIKLVTVNWNMPWNADCWWPSIYVCFEKPPFCKNMIWKQSFKWYQNKVVLIAYFSDADGIFLEKFR